MKLCIVMRINCIYLNNLYLSENIGKGARREAREREFRTET